MNKLIIISIMAGFFLSACSPEGVVHKTPEIIPLPANIQMQKGEFIINKETKISAVAEEEKNAAEFLRKQIKQLKAYQLPVTDEKNGDNTIVFSIIEADSLGKEGYNLLVNTHKIVIQANTGNGLFYGLQTLYQSLPPKIYSSENQDTLKLLVPAMKISDQPRFAYRGIHLDVSRHFYPLNFIKRYIDILAMHKINTFHWHLVDDQGWRIEIKQYPKLTEIGAKRINREDKPWHKRNYKITEDTTYYQGFYTQEQIKDVIAYAKKRYITIIPEIEMPAHVMSAIAAYPHLSCRQEQIEVPSGSVWPITEIYCAGNDKVFEFNENVLAEVIELFPSKYIHIGGDEAHKKNWEKCPKCQKRIKEEGLKDENELQSYFIKRIEKFIVSNGKQLIGWDEILEGGLAPEATVMSWRGVKGGIEAAKAGHDVIMTPTSHCYFDYYQGDKETEPLAIGGYLPLQKVYSFEPVAPELSEEEAEHVLGAQANVWTEYMYNGKHVEYMLMPRISAIAEVNWTSKDKKDWALFRKRIDTQLLRYKAAGYNYSESSLTVVEKMQKK